MPPTEWLYRADIDYFRDDVWACINITWSFYMYILNREERKKLRIEKG